MTHCRVSACAIAVMLSLFVPPACVAQGTVDPTPASVVARYRAARLATMQEGATAADVDAVLRLLADSVVYEHPQAGARLVGQAAIGAGIQRFLGATRNARLEVLREIVTGSALAAEERVTFEVPRDGGWTIASRTQLVVYYVQGDRILRELQYWTPR